MNENYHKNLGVAGLKKIKMHNIEIIYADYIINVRTVLFQC